MARSHAKIHCSIWDPGSDFIALTGGAQRIYQLLLSQKKLTLVGLLTYTPSRWARLAADTTLASVEGDIDELEASRFVVVDRDTDELLIRTLVKNDVANGRLLDNVNLLRGMWNAWTAIESRLLRLVAVENIPASVWDSPKAQPPAEALDLRDQPSQSTRSTQLERPVPMSHSDEPLEQVVPTSLRPSPFLVEGFPAAAEALETESDHEAAAAVDNSTFEQALSLLTERELLRNPSHSNPRRHREATLRGKRRDHVARAHELLRLDPHATPEQLADALEPDGHMPAEPGRMTPDGIPFVPGTGPAPGLPAGESPWLKPPADVLAAARQRLAHPNASEAS